MAWVLKNDRLILTIEEPGHLYKGSRFDRSGNILQVLLDGKWNFCTTEKTMNFDAGQQGQGLYNEFGINKPVGYEECKAGQKFLKIGVGLLTRTGDGTYDFLASYPVDPFEIRVEQLQNKIRFIVMPEDCRGYAVKLVKEITLSGNSFHIDYELENTGTKRIRTNEYCHNFISINHSRIDSNYSLKIRGKIPDHKVMTEAVNPEKAVTTDSDTLTFNFIPGEDIFFSPFAIFTGNGEWTITHRGLGLGVSEFSDFVPELMNVWGSSHVLSPELFKNIDLMPGLTQRWRRTFEFYTV